MTGWQSPLLNTIGMVSVAIGLAWQAGPMALIGFGIAVVVCDALLEDRAYGQHLAASSRRVEDAGDDKAHVHAASAGRRPHLRRNRTEEN